MEHASNALCLTARLAEPKILVRPATQDSCHLTVEPIVSPVLLTNARTVMQQGLAAHASVAISQIQTKILASLAQFLTVSSVTQQTHATNAPAAILSSTMFATPAPCPTARAAVKMINAVNVWPHIICITMLATCALSPIANSASKTMFAPPALVPTFLKTVEQLVNVPILALPLPTTSVFVLVVPLNIMVTVIPAQLLLALHVNKIMSALLV